jgi:transposase
MLELPYCNTANFQLFLEELSKYYPDELKLIVLDNGAFHKADRLFVPKDIILIFLPPYSPELNPAEKIRAKFKRSFTNRLFVDMHSLSDFVCELANKLKSNEVISICSFDYVFSGNYWTIL